MCLAFRFVVVDGVGWRIAYARKGSRSRPFTGTCLITDWYDGVREAHPEYHPLNLCDDAIIVRFGVRLRQRYSPGVVHACCGCFGKGMSGISSFLRLKGKFGN